MPKEGLWTTCRVQGCLHRWQQDLCLPATNSPTRRQRCPTGRGTAKGLNGRHPQVRTLFWTARHSIGFNNSVNHGVQSLLA